VREGTAVRSIGLADGTANGGHHRDRECEEVHMPSFEYICKDCGREFIVFFSLKEYETKPKVICPHCGGDHVERKFSAFSAKTSRKS